jgi:hypothetical protein
MGRNQGRRASFVPGQWQVCIHEADLVHIVQSSLCHLPDFFSWQKWEKGGWKGGGGRGIQGPRRVCPR